MAATSTVMSSAMSCSQRSSSSSLSSRRISSSKRSIVSLKNRKHASSKSSYSRKETVVVSASSAKIKVVVCGGGGGNAVNRMIEAGVSVRLLFFKALSTKINGRRFEIEADYENLSRPFYAHESLVLKNSVFDRSFKSSVLYRKMLGFRVSARFDERDRENQNTFLFVEFESPRSGKKLKKTYNSPLFYASFSFTTIKLTVLTGR